MSTRKKVAPGNVYVDLDSALTGQLKLKVGQNLIFIRAFSCAGGPFLRSLKMPVPYFVTADINHGTQIPGQPKDTYVVALGLVHSAGTGEILIRFEPQTSCQNQRRLVRLKFCISE